MKKILVTGKSSYVGESLEKWLKNYPDRYSIESISLRDDSWRETDFSKFDIVFHVAGIAHKRETKSNSTQYFKVNRDLAYETAKKAKSEGVKQIVFLSSMSVYGIEKGVITKDSTLDPKNSYGKSKLEAEELITSLGDDAFKIAILRPPMIYGKNSKGNYAKLATLARKSPVFPDIRNKRSMIYIDNLCEFVRLLIDNCSSGLFFPQNNDYVCTSDMVKYIALENGNRIKLTKLFNPFINLIKVNFINKVFGDLIYEKEMSKHEKNYCLYEFRESIIKTEV